MITLVMLFAISMLYFAANMIHEQRSNRQPVNRKGADHRN